MSELNQRMEEIAKHPVLWARLVISITAIIINCLKRKPLHLEHLMDPCLEGIDKKLKSSWDKDGIIVPKSICGSM